MFCTLHYEGDPLPLDRLEMLPIEHVQYYCSNDTNFYFFNFSAEVNKHEIQTLIEYVLGSRIWTVIEAGPRDRNENLIYQVIRNNSSKIWKPKQKPLAQNGCGTVPRVCPPATAFLCDVPSAAAAAAASSGIANNAAASSTQHVEDLFEWKSFLCADFDQREF